MRVFYELSKFSVLWRITDYDYMANTIDVSQCWRNRIPQFPGHHDARWPAVF